MDLVKKIKECCSNKLNLILVILVTIFITISFFYAQYVRKQTEALLVEQMQHREQLAARIAANSVNNFFNLVDKSLLTLSKNSHIVDNNPDVENLLEEFSNDFKGTPVIGAYFVNVNGVIKYQAENMLEELSALGVDVSDRDYVVKAKKIEKGGIITGKPILARLPNAALYIIPISTPIFVNGAYNGTLVAPVYLKKLAEDYLDPAKISDNTKVYLLDSRGTMLYAPYEDYIGKSYFDVLQASGTEGLEESEKLLKGALVAGVEGKLDMEFLGIDKEGEIVLQRYILAHVPIFHEDEETRWTLGVATPVTDVFEFYGSTRKMLAGGTLLIVVTIFTFAATTVFLVKVAQKGAHKKSNINDSNESGKISSKKP